MQCRSLLKQDLLFVIANEVKQSHRDKMVTDKMVTDTIKINEKIKGKAKESRELTNMTKEMVSVTIYHRWNGTLWNLQTVDNVLGYDRSTSLAIDSNGTPCISYSYIDGTNDYLKYARLKLQP
jgi:hypothetical protein